MKLLRKVVLAGATLGLLANAAAAQTSHRDAIADWLTTNRSAAPKLAQTTKPEKKPDSKAATRDPREGDETYEQAKRLMKAIDAILADAAKERSASNKLPSKDDFILTPLWTETKEDRDSRIRELLDAALGIVTDVPIVDVQKRIELRRKAIRVSIRTFRPIATFSRLILSVSVRALYIRCSASGSNPSARRHTRSPSVSSPWMASAILRVISSCNANRSWNSRS